MSSRTSGKLAHGATVDLGLGLDQLTDHQRTPEPGVGGRLEIVEPRSQGESGRIQDLELLLDADGQVSAGSKDLPDVLVDPHVVPPVAGPNAAGSSGPLLEWLPNESTRWSFHAWSRAEAACPTTCQPKTRMPLSSPGRRRATATRFANCTRRTQGGATTSPFVCSATPGTRRTCCKKPSSRPSGPCPASRATPASARGSTASW